jgi:O-antigen/teichoic acid export membrane protein
VSTAAAAIAWIFKDKVQPEALYTFFIALFLLPFFSLTAIRRAALRGLRHVILGRLTESLIRPLLFVSLLLIAYFALRMELDAAMVMALRVTGAAIVLLIGSLILHRMTPRAVKDSVPEYHARIWLGSALPFAVIFGMQTLNDQANLVILGAMTTSDQVGIYAASVRLAEAITLIFAAVEFTIAPYIASLHSTEQTTRLQNLILKTARLVFVLSLPVALAFIFYGDWFQALFGEEFRAGRWALAILGIGRLLNVAFGPVKALALMTGQERATAWIMGAVALLNVVLNLVLVPFWGIIGAATATAISTVAWSSMLCVLAFKRTGVVSFVVSLKRRSRAGIREQR